MKIYEGKLLRPVEMDLIPWAGTPERRVLVPAGATVSVIKGGDELSLNYQPDHEDFLGDVYQTVVPATWVQVGRVIQTLNEGEHPMPDWKPEPGNVAHQPIPSAVNHPLRSNIASLIDGEWMDGTLPTDDWISHPSDTITDWWGAVELTVHDYEGRVDPGWWILNINNYGVRSLYGPATREQVSALFAEIEENWDA